VASLPLKKLGFQSLRLTLREFKLEDAPFVYELVNSPGWLRYIGDRQIGDASAAAAYIGSKLMPSYEKHGFGLFHVTERASQKAVGMCGILKRDWLDHPDLGFAFLPEFQGKGFATEASESVLREVSQALGIKQVLAITKPDHSVSIRVLQKLGFVRETQVIDPQGETLELFNFRSQPY